MSKKPKCTLFLWRRVWPIKKRLSFRMAAVKMNSSTNPPMNKSQKFKFDIDFDAEEERLRLEAERREEEERKAARENDIAAKVVTYSEEEMARIRDEAYQKGLAEGEAKSNQSLEQAISELVDRAAGKLRMLIEKDE